MFTRLVIEKLGGTLVYQMDESFIIGKQKVPTKIPHSLTENGYFQNESSCFKTTKCIWIKRSSV